MKSNVSMAVGISLLVVAGIAAVFGLYVGLKDLSKPAANNYFVHNLPTPTPDANATPLPTPRPPTKAEIAKSEAEALKFGIEQRKAYIDRKEAELLDKGMDAYLSLRGKKQDELQIKYILMSRPMVHQLSKDPDFIGTLQRYGFKRVHFTDGYNESWSLSIE